ncbi:excinuclease ABC subunit UvrB [Acidaminobacter sp. JC074]|uniref:excinuclease ABC subunit UvrB n=1 Tax=Acidaminobacter sp. JC074 TaxID=2530199 RepID=UPI001F0D9B31|nr:excinuclease ABC subunit UvrB [Acidaminobacter sp. JC074]MCH4889575.1 excinuclease ABC subunit UvrB [Acidaminobacter sp. JC074]
MKKFELVSEYKPTGDQPEAIDKLVKSIESGERYQTLLGVTGSGKTFTMANVIEKVQKKTLVIAHNKTLAGQLCAEFKEFFPNNAVEFFVSYYDYYQPEAYIPGADVFIEKDSSINDEIDKLRHSATLSLFDRDDVIVVASVSCIYGLGDPVDYKNMVISLRPGMEKSRESLIEKLVELQYNRNDISFVRGTFRVRGDVVEIFPISNDKIAYRVEFFGDEVDRISEVNVVTGEILGLRDHVAVLPASHYVTQKEKIDAAIKRIEDEMIEQVQVFKEQGKLIEAQRIEQRTNYDIEMLKEVGFCSGIENYSRPISGREAGCRPYTLLDYFGDDWMVVIDESHVSIPQIRGMYAGDQSRKKTLVDYGFRLPSAMDNRPLNFDEFESLIKQAVFVSATPGPYEKEHSKEVVEQIIRPTGLLDPPIDIRPVEGQIDDLYTEIMNRTKKNERVLVTTLTKKMAEDLTDYFKELNVKVKYMHSDIDTFERLDIIRDLRKGEFDVLIGINLLREGLDLPEVSLVAILDADKEGFLRSETSLIQTVGRAARNSEGKVIMYANRITKSMQKTIDETLRRRKLQEDYNSEHGIIPKTISKTIRDEIKATHVAEDDALYEEMSEYDAEDLYELIENIRDEMKQAAGDLQFERAAELRDKITDLEKLIDKK